MPGIAITCGDPAGVGLELIERWLRADPAAGRDCMVIGPRSWLDSLPVDGIPVGPANYRPTPGVPDAAGAKIAWQALEMAARGCSEGLFSGVVTAPISKRQMQAVGFPYPGHTEFFGDLWGGQPVMGFAGERLRVVLATWHIPLMQVGRTLENDPLLIERAVAAAAQLARTADPRIAEPRIAVCGLNPHAGEDGLLGDEEYAWLNPLLDRLRGEYPMLSPALPGDTVFHRQLAGDFDVVVALYHDQGLAPLKTLEFHTAVNLTLGLRFPRSSPDHGTAFQLAGKGTADGRSFAAAVDWLRRTSAAK
jgi:4-hydroxythreonine-4-phosphate dehydrogenase